MAHVQGRGCRIYANIDSYFLVRYETLQVVSFATFISKFQILLEKYAEPYPLPYNLIDNATLLKQIQDTFIASTGYICRIVVEFELRW